MIKVDLQMGAFLSLKSASVAADAYSIINDSKFGGPLSYIKLCVKTTTLFQDYIAALRGVVSDKEKEVALQNVKSLQMNLQKLKDLQSQHNLHVSEQEVKVLYAQLEQAKDQLTDLSEHAKKNWIEKLWHQMWSTTSMKDKFKSIEAKVNLVVQKCTLLVTTLNLELTTSLKKEMSLKQKNTPLELQKMSLKQNNILLELQKMSLKQKNILLELQMSLKLKNILLELQMISLKLKNILLELQMISLKLKNILLELQEMNSEVGALKKKMIPGKPDPPETFSVSSSTAKFTLTPPKQVCPTESPVTKTENRICNAYRHQRMDADGQTYTRKCRRKMSFNAELTATKRVEVKNADYSKATVSFELTHSYVDSLCAHFHVVIIIIIIAIAFIVCTYVLC